MITANLYTLAKGDLVGFHLTGHSGYAESGSDIVCAAVSSVAYMVANTITDVIKVSAEVEASDGDIMLRVFQKDAISCRDILQGLKLHLLQLEEQYPDYLIVKTTEV